MSSRLFTLVLVLASCVGCGTYRTSSGGYRGVGEFRTGADYTSPNSDVDSDQQSQLAANTHVAPHAPYVPRYPFKLHWPLARIRINRGFHPSSDPHHAGLDMGGTRGTPVLAAHEGVVIYEGHDFHGYGKMMIVEYDDQWATLYAHLDSYTVPEGRVVGPGDPIGKMGSTGHATGVHLHFELMHNHKPMDPLAMLPHASHFAQNHR